MEGLRSIHTASGRLAVKRSVPGTPADGSSATPTTGATGADRGEDQRSEQEQIRGASQRQLMEKVLDDMNESLKEFLNTAYLLASVYYRCGQASMDDERVHWEEKIKLTWPSSTQPSSTG